MISPIYHIGTPAGALFNIMWLWQTRVLALEKSFQQAHKRLNRLIRRVEYSPGSVDLKAVKTQLDLVKTLISLIREETAFYVKLGQLYDLTHLFDEIFKIFDRQDPAVVLEMYKEVDTLWQKALRNQFGDKN